MQELTTPAYYSDTTPGFNLKRAFRPFKKGSLGLVNGTLTMKGTDGNAVFTIAIQEIRKVKRRDVTLHIYTKNKLFVNQTIGFGEPNNYQSQQISAGLSVPRGGNEDVLMKIVDKASPVINQWLDIFKSHGIKVSSRTYNPYRRLMKRVYFVTLWVCAILLLWFFIAHYLTQ